MTRRVQDLQVVSEIGHRKHMEDAYYITKNPEHRFKLYFVFDGHSGSTCANWLSVKYEMLDELFNCSQSTANILQHDKEITDLLQEYHHTLLDEYRLNWSDYSDGSTITGVVLDEDRQKLLFCNLGDSQSFVVCKGQRRQPVYKTFRDSCDDINERKRLEEQDISVQYDGYCYRLDGGLNISRAFGNFQNSYLAKALDESGRDLVFKWLDLSQFDKTVTLQVWVASDGLVDDVNAKSISTTKSLQNKPVSKLYISIHNTHGYKHDNFTVIRFDLTT